MTISLIDRELLELAAKAAGYKIRFTYEGNGAGEAVNYREYEVCEKRWEESPTHWGYSKWNPLEDDGDALRLAVELGIRFTRYIPENVVDAEAYSTDVFCYAREDCNDIDPYAATRRAIVRAAAEIGKTMQ